MQLPKNLSLNTSVHSLEDGIITLSGPALAISSVLAVVDLLTGGHILQQYAWFSLAWAICLALTLDFQILALGARSHQIYQSDKKTSKRKVVEIALCLIVAASISLVSIQMQSIIARVNSFSGLTIEVAAQQLGINTIYLIWERSALVLVLIFLSGWFREVKKVEQDFSTGKTDGTNTSISDETMQLILSKLAKLDQLEQTLSKPQVTVIAESEAPLALPSPSKVVDLNIGRVRMKRDLQSLIMVESITDEQAVPSVENVEKLSAPDFPSVFPDGTEVDEANLKAQVTRVLREQPDIKIRDLVAIVGGPQTTVYRHMVQVKKQLEKVEQNGKGE